jgi:DNA-directed RNA polymerase specialized sigma subunit
VFYAPKPLHRHLLLLLLLLSIAPSHPSTLSSLHLCQLCHSSLDMDSSRSSRQRAPKGASAVAERLRKARQGEREETAIPVKDNVLDEVDEDEYEQLVEARKARGQFVLDDDQGDDDDDDDEQGDGYEDDGEEFWDTSNDKSSKTGTKRKARGMLRERERERASSGALLGI